MKHAFQPRRAAIAALALGATLGLVLPAHAAVPPAERQALVDLYNSTGGAAWTNNTNWNTGDPCDNNWFGIACNATKDHVRKIDLESNKLDGTLPSSLAGLTALEWFVASDNQLTGPIPSLTGLTVLKYFYAWGNQLTGPIPSLTGLTALEFFSVADNQLTGPIPSLTGLTALQRFSAWDNQLTGPIPSLTGLTALKSFSVNGNQLTGPIPSLTGLTALESFWVSGNQLTGAIPSLTGLTALKHFFAYGNQLTGTPPGVPIDVTLNAAGSWLCPNFLHTPSPTDLAWNAAVGGTWSDGCTPGYLVSTSAGAGGSVDPSRAVVAGATTAVAVTPDATHQIDAVTSTCGGALSGDSWTTDPINADCTVTASFKAKAIAPAAVTPVPTLGEWALMALAGLLAGLGLRRLPRRHG